MIKPLLANGLEFMQTVFTNLYTYAFKKDDFPYSILPADGIFDAGYGSEAYDNSNSTSYFVSIGNTRPGIESFTPEAMKVINDEYPKMKQKCALLRNERDAAMRGL